MRILTFSPGLKGKAESLVIAEGIVRYKVFAFLCGINVVSAPIATYNYYSNI